MPTNILTKAIVALAACLAIRATSVLAESGDLDPTFGIGGRTEMQMDQPADVNGMALQSDGKIVVVGFGQYRNSDFAVVRYNSDGSPDSTFGIGGKITTPIEGSDDYGEAVAVQRDGKIVVAGHYTTGAEWRPAVVRYLADGTLDTTFGGGNGKQTWWGPTRVSSVAVQIDGKILVAGGTDYHFWLDRLNADGSPDESFGAHGSAWARFGVTTDDRHSFANAMAVQSDGRIVLAGWVRIKGLEEFALARFLTNGQLDPTFGTAGELIVNIGTYDNGANCVAVSSNGKILVGGYSDNGSGQIFTLLRLTQWGIIDATLGANGVVTTAITGSRDNCTGLAIQSDGKILAVGYALWATQVALVRYTDRGILDTDFGNMGKVTSSRTAYKPSIVLQGDGKVLVAGSSLFTVERFIGPAVPEIAVEQPAGTDLADGGVSLAFGKAEVGGTPAIRTFTVRNVGTSRLTGLAVTKDGVNSDDFTVGNLGATNLPMGAITTVTVIFAPSALGSRTAAIHIASNDADENPFDIALEGTGVPPLAIATASPLPVGTVGAEYDYTLTANGGTTAYTWSVSGGSLPVGLSLSSAGVLNGTPVEATNANFTARVAGGGGASATRTFELRILGPSDPGALDVAFGNGGKLTTAVGSRDDRGNSVAVQSDGKVLVAGSSFNGTDLDFALVRYHPNGTLDTNFGTLGVVTTPIGSGNDEAYGVVLQNNGKIVVAGYSHNGFDYDFAVARYESDGRLDTSFGGDGKVTTAIGALHDMGQSVAMQSDGKIVVAGYSYNGGNNDFALVRYESDGRLDTSFGGDGKTTTPIGSDDDLGRSVAIQGDGKIVVAGNSRNGNNDDFALARFKLDGALDTDFGVGGKVTTPIGGFNDFGYGMALQSDGKIVVAGFTSTGSDSDFALVRYSANGSLDVSFGSNGVVVTPIGGYGDIGQGMALQSDGKILVAGYSVGGGNFDFTLARYRTDGGLDTSFGDGGKLITPVGSADDIARSVAVQADGKILVAGYADNGSGNNDFALVRYLGTTTPEIAVEQPAGNNLTDGFSSVNFGNLGLDGGPATRWFTVRNASTATLSGLTVSLDGANAGDFALGSLDATTLGPGENMTFSVSFLPGVVGPRTAAIHVASNDADENPFDVVLSGAGVVAPDITTANLLPSGMVGVPYNFTLTASGGTTPYTWTLFSDLPADLSLSSAGVLSGTPVTALTTNFNVRVFGSDGLASSKVTFTLTIIPALKPGDLDPTFGNGGKVTLSVGGADDYGYSAAVQSDGKIVVAGYSVIGGYEKFALARYLADGTLDLSFGNSGKVTSAISPYRDYGRSLALQSDGKLLLAGEASLSGGFGIALARYLTDGALDTSFGNGGRVTNSFSVPSYGKTVLVQSDGKIVVAGQVSTSCMDYGLVRYLADGTLDITFGDGGKVSTDFGADSCDYAQGAALQGDDKLLMVGYAPGTSGDDFALVRYLVNGSLDTTFGNGGKVSTPFTSGRDSGRSIVVQSDGKIVVAGDSGGDFAVVRYFSDGSLDTGFGTMGKVTTKIGNYDDLPQSVVVQSDGKIVVAGYSGNGSNYDFSLARYNTNGTLDASFGTGGKLMTAVGSGHDRGRSVVLQSDGKILVAGESYNGTNYDFALVRYIGLLEPEIAVEQPAGTNLTDNGVGVYFGSEEVGGVSPARTFTVRNAGTASLTGLAVYKDGTNASDFTVGNLSTTTLAPGASTSLSVTFAPSEYGWRVAGIHILSNDTDENPFDITLTGTGGSSRPLEAWRLTHFGSADNSGDGADLNDFDGDGFPNLLEYAFGGDPKKPDASAMRLTPTFAGGKFSCSFKCDAQCTDITYTVQASPSLEAGSWTDIARSAGGAAVLPVGLLSEVSDAGIGLRTATVTTSVALFPTGCGFLRLKISQ